MTNDFKQKLFQWLIGTYSTQNDPNNFDTFIQEEKQPIEKTLIDYLSLSILGGTTRILNVVQITSPKGNNLNWLIVLLWDDMNKKGYIQVYDEIMDLVCMFNQYDSGANIGRIDDIKVDEEGRLYAVEIRPTESRIRFIYLNNFCVKVGDTYKLDIRKAYNFPIDWDRFSALYDYMKTYMYKIPGTPKYCLILKTIRDSSSVIESYDITILEVNVEEGNTWKNTRISAVRNKCYKPYVVWNNNKLFTIRATGLNSYDESINEIYYIYAVEKAELSDNTWFTQNNRFITLNTNIKVPKDSDCYFLDSDNLIICETHNNTTYLSKILINNTSGTINTLYTLSTYLDYTKLIFAESNGYLYAYFCSIKDGEQHSSGENEFCFHILNKTSSITSNDIKKYTIVDRTQVLGLVPKEIFMVLNSFNLYNYFGIYRGYDYEHDKDYYGYIEVQEVYNENNYNGSPYKALNSLIGKQGYLYDGNDYLIFARNLYNKTIQSNKTTYSIEVPNTMLNDIDISIQKLLSETKNIMNNNEEIINTNIYEELIINFINYITMVNQNDENNPIYNRIGASRLNSSISRDKDYLNTKMTKYRINYIDGTSVVDEFEIVSQGTSATINFEFNTKYTTAVRNIEFISDDELTVYNTITPTLEMGKRYEITQSVHIE